jgi:hypothetical protein
MIRSAFAHGHYEHPRSDPQPAEGDVSDQIGARERTFRRRREGVVGHHHLIGRGLDLAPLDLLRLPAAETPPQTSETASASDKSTGDRALESSPRVVPEEARHEADEPGLLVLAARKPH